MWADIGGWLVIVALVGLFFLFAWAHIKDSEDHDDVIAKWEKQRLRDKEQCLRDDKNNVFPS
jgi:hypothetical protein